MNNQNKHIIILFSLLIISGLAFSQISDPVVITELHESVSENSGLIFYNSSLWSHNDSGNDAILYSIDTTNGEIIQTKSINGVENIDWEDICKDDTYAYIGDIGNNSGTRQDFKIYKISLEDLDSYALNIIDAEEIIFNYNPEYYPPSKTHRSNDTDFDCEAMIAFEDSIYLFSKNWNNKKCYLYSIPKTPGNYIANLKDTLDTNGLICGAAYCSETNSIALTGYVYGIPAPSLIFLLSNFEGNNFFSGNVTRKELPLDGYQTEGITYRNSSELWISNENFLGHSQTLFSIQLNNSNINSNNLYEPNIFPNPASKNINLTFPVEGKYKIKITDSISAIVYKNTLRISETSKEQPIDISYLKPGTYFISISNSKITYTSSFIKI